MIYVCMYVLTVVLCCLKSDLPAAIRQSEKLRQSKKDWPPVNSGEDPSRRGITGVMDYEMGFVD